MDWPTGGHRLSLSTLEQSLPERSRLPLLPAAIVFYAIGAALLAPDAYVSMLALYANQIVPLSILLLVGPPIVAICLRPRAPVAYLRELFQKGALRLVMVCVLLCFGLAAFTTYKLSIPTLVPYYADPVFADLDAWLHVGNPGEWAHMVLPSWASYPLGYLYGPGWFMLWFGFIALVALNGDRALRQRYFWTMAIAFCVLGTVAATALSSVGPVFYERFFHVDRYAALMEMIRTSAVGDYMSEATGYLYANYASGGHQAGTGISAMPSMHLGVVTLNALMLSRLHRLLGIAGWTYVAVILFGSVYLGWHYAIDGYVSIAFVVLVWWLIGRLIALRTASSV
jgi:hypothetical protein